ncbi:MAG: hypothetical protein IJU40_02855 [Desulfovibrionaceae bacterium]|nr:hypothetical protein [Desulfovibrionaceae bacterium]
MQTQPILNIKAENLFFAGDLKGAEACCRQMLSQDRRNHGALSRLGDIALARGDLKAAETLYRKSLDIAVSLHATLGLTKLNQTSVWVM